MIMVMIYVFFIIPPKVMIQFIMKMDVLRKPFQNGDDKR